jgi:hypothetical protein
MAFFAGPERHGVLSRDFHVLNNRHGNDAIRCRRPVLLHKYMVTPESHALLFETFKFVLEKAIVSFDNYFSVGIVLHDRHGSLAIRCGKPVPLHKYMVTTYLTP